ncbi:MAG TPA: SGNH/GDSL hydrolase family protein, partial [Bacillota bacterium]|nr:SGNH/GDSL hydrolase family protein [Bacillota bacterium]
MIAVLSGLVLLALAAAPAALSSTTTSKPLAGRVVFLGDSITYAGQYVEFVETGSRLFSPTGELEVLNLGLPSETVSGLSEPGHAGGAFPRPDLQERLSRVLQKTHPDVVIACYGMNDGIYYPFGEERFQQFQAGIRRLRDQVTAAGARILFLTPPVFDPLPIQAKTLPAGQSTYPHPYVGYNEVLDRYSEWLRSQRARGWEVVDVHGPINQFLAAQRQREPQFCLARDGVHPDVTGHWLMAQALLTYLGVPAEQVTSADQMLAHSPAAA